jgi:predicted methyltransferase
MKFHFQSILILTSILALLTACSSEQLGMSSNQPATQSSSAMPTSIEPASNTGRSVIQSIPSNVNQDIYEAALADIRRPMEEMGRDSGRKPIEVLKYFGVGPGMRVVDVGSSDGYYTRIISGVVGSNGSVVANNSGRRSSDEFRAKYIEQYSSYDNVELNFENPEDISLPDNSVDVVLLSLAVHHWHHDDASGEMTPPISLQRYENILRILKPGGIFAVIDHAALPGASRQASDAIHRIPEPILVSDVTIAGFVMEGESSIHANHPEDDIMTRWGDGPRDMTNRIVVKFRKP